MSSEDHGQAQIKFNYDLQQVIYGVDLNKLWLQFKKYETVNISKGPTLGKKLNVKNIQEINH